MFTDVWHTNTLAAHDLFCNTHVWDSLESSIRRIENAVRACMCDVENVFHSRHTLYISLWSYFVPSTVQTMFGASSSHSLTIRCDAAMIVFLLSLSSFVRLYESVKSFFLLLLDYHLKCIKWRIVYVHCSLPILIPFTSATFSLTYEKMPHIYCLEWLPTRKIERKSGYLSFYTISNK